MASLGQRTYLPASSIITMKLSSSKQTDLGAALVWLLVAKRRNLVAYLWQHHDLMFEGTNQQVGQNHYWGESHVGIHYPV